jgi:hypothetical protein
MQKAMQNFYKARVSEERVRRLMTWEAVSAPTRSSYAGGLLILLLASMIALSACGGVNSSDPQSSATLSGNWQLSLVNTPDLTASSGLQGGFLLQNGGSVAGAVVYSNTLLSSATGPCNSGSAPITGTTSGQNAVTLTAVAGTQSFSLTGTLSSDGSMMTGTYTSTAGTAADGTPCGSGTAQTGPQTWTAKSVPPLTGSITGNFHSSSSYNSGLSNQDFPVTGSFTQGENIGASNATVTGTLSFIDPITLLSDYPCVPSGSIYVNGQISGNTVVLQLIGTAGSNEGQIGIPASQAISGNIPQLVTFDSTTNGLVLHSAGTGYVVNTKTCPTNADVNDEDGGYLCLALNSSTACQQPITLSPALLIFPPQLLGSTNPPAQTITLTDTQASGSTPLNGLKLNWSAASSSSSDIGQTDFTNLPNFMEADNCAAPPGSAFSLVPGQSCTITVSFAPQEDCTWLPNQGGTAPAQCPLTLNATLMVSNVPSTDNDKNFTVPITGAGSSFIQPSVPELDFGAEAFGEASLPQFLYFTNYGATPVQILPKAPCDNATLDQFHILPHPLEYPGSQVAGLQVVSDLRQDTNNSTIDYSCDFDPYTMLPNFRIVSDTCSGTLLEPQDACSLQVVFAPQSTATYFSALDYFLELNTVQCTNPVNDPPSPANPCEIDGGRLPVELKANITSPLRMSPGAGLDFGNVTVGKSSVTQSITLLSDPSLTNPQTVTFIGKVVVSGTYSETDDCPLSLAPGSGCTITVTFKPSAVGHDPGTLSINYTTNSNSTLQTQTVYLRGTGQ